MLATLKRGWCPHQAIINRSMLRPEGLRVAICNFLPFVMNLISCASKPWDSSKYASSLYTSWRTLTSHTSDNNASGNESQDLIITLLLSAYSLFLFWYHGSIWHCNNFVILEWSLHEGHIAFFISSDCCIQLDSLLSLNRKPLRP